ncbi:MAG: hypothetical protein JWM95_2429 [Gemmatimonadetes bacterium]|nr:hypothetical protein [Gemmatimonadota bacterium]
MFEYERTQRRISFRKKRTAPRAVPIPGGPLGSIVTLIDPSLRPIVNLITSGHFVSVHTDTLESARHALEDHRNSTWHIRLLHVSAYLESTALSLSDVAHALEYSSPQSLIRHLRTQLGVTGSEFRAWGFEQVWGSVADCFLRNQRPALARLEPFRG